MAVSLMGSFGDSQGGSFWDDEPAGGGYNEGTTGAGGGGGGGGAGDADYMQVTTHSTAAVAGEETEKIVNPFDTFKDDEDPDDYMQVYETLKEDVRAIEKNSRAIQKLSQRYNASTVKEENQSIMHDLDDIMSNNSRLTNKIKGQLKSEKIKNDAYAQTNEGSSVGQWRINQLNSCTRRFKTCSLEFSRQLTDFNATLREKQKRHIDILDENKLSEAEKEEMVNDYDRAEAFIQEQFQMIQTSDALMDRLEELEDRHQGMLKIEKSVKELQELWMELSVLVTEQQELLDNVTKNVEQTRDYVKSATKHLQKAEQKQKCSRKLQLWLMCCCLLLLLVLVFSLFGAGVFTGS